MSDSVIEKILYTASSGNTEITAVRDYAFFKAVGEQPLLKTTWLPFLGMDDSMRLKTPTLKQRVEELEFSRNASTAQALRHITYNELNVCSRLGNYETLIISYGLGGGLWDIGNETQQGDQGACNYGETGFIGERLMEAAKELYLYAVLSARKCHIAPVASFETGYPEDVNLWLVEKLGHEPALYNARQTDQRLHAWSTEGYDQPY